jgi:hypothetical protein
MVFRSKHFNKQLEQTDLFFKEVDTCPTLFELDSNNQAQCYISKSIWEDININEWIETLSPHKNTHHFLEAYLKTPINNSIELKKRQTSLRYFQKRTLPSLWNNPSDLSTHWNWALSLDSHLKNYLMDTLYPRSWPMKALCYQPSLLSSYQIYRAYISPVTQSIYPISVIFGPYMYLRQKLKWNLTLKAYLTFIGQGLQWIYKNTHLQFKNIAMILVYVGIYVYSFILAIDLSNQLRKYRQRILSRMKQLTQTIQRFQQILKNIPNDFWESYILPNHSITRSDLMKPWKGSAYMFYRLWKYPAEQARLKNIYTAMTIYDGLQSLSKLLKKRTCDWCFPTYDSSAGGATYYTSMKHPLLINAVPNPIYMKRHLIMTGPNAGGKTTYVKSFLWNILLSQSFGICRAAQGNINPYEAILHHDRIKDLIGSQSLFEAEMTKAKEVLEIAERFPKAIYFMDEPFHSTPPMDGAAMLKAMMLYLAKQTSCKMILTTHYFSVQDLEKDEPALFKNISVEGNQIDDKYQFTYRIKSGFSKQSIGIELLKTREFPPELIQTAIKMKNKLYDIHVNV